MNPFPWLLVCAVAFGGAAFVGALATRAARAAGLRLGLMDRPGGRKAHAAPVALTGGWAIFATFVLMTAAGGLLAPALAQWVPAALDPLPHYLENLRGARGDLAAILLGSVWIFAVGAIDDARPMGPWIKLLAQILAAVPLLAAGISIRLFLPVPALGWAATILWLVVLMNAFNFIDNMDGLCATVAGVIALVLAIAAWQVGQLWLPVLLLTFAGAMLGFLVFNFHPASIFLGDAGSLLIGYLLGVFSIMITFYQPDQASGGLPVLIPVAIMGVPLFDAASVLIIRWLAGKPLMVGDRNHFSHRLQALGMSVRQTAVTIGMLTGAIGLAALALRHLGLAEALLHLLALIMLFGVIAALEFFGRYRKSER